MWYKLKANNDAGCGGVLCVMLYCDGFLGKSKVHRDFFLHRTRGSLAL